MDYSSVLNTAISILANQVPPPGSAVDMPPDEPDTSSVLHAALSILANQVPQPDSAVDMSPDEPDTSSVLYAALSILANQVPPPGSAVAMSPDEPDTSSVLYAALSILANQTPIPALDQSSADSSLAQSNNANGLSIFSNLFTFSDIKPQRRSAIITKIAQEVTNSTVKIPPFLTTHMPIFEDGSPYRISGYKPIVGDLPVPSVEDLEEAIKQINKLKTDVAIAKSRL